MKRTHFLSGVGIFVILVLLIATQMTFGARGSTAQEIQGSPWNIRIIEGDTCWDLAQKYSPTGNCGEFLALNAGQVAFLNNGEPLLKVGGLYEMPYSWLVLFQVRDGGRHQLVRDPFETPEGQVSPTSDQDKGPAGLITGAALGALIVIFLLVLTVVIWKRVLPRVRSTSLFRWFANFLGERHVLRQT